MHYYFLTVTPSKFTSLLDIIVPVLSSCSIKATVIAYSDCNKLKIEDDQSEASLPVYTTKQTYC